ncbi:MAG: alpha/beta fold hydrolase [Gemmatimonadaceae bacterium]
MSAAFMTGPAAQQAPGARGALPGVPGRLIDVGGHRLHINCVGEGSPTVVIDGGVGSWSIFFDHVQKRISSARVCTYDRAGMGWSESGPLPRTSARMVDELHSLLHRSGAAPPLILVGHSIGGYNVRLYQSRYPEEVGAIVLIDAAHEEQWDRLPVQARQLAAASAAGLRRRAEQARAGKLSASEITPPGVIQRHSPQHREAYTMAMLDAATYDAIAAETEASFESARQVPTRRSLGDLPLVVVTARNSFDAFRGSGIPIPEANAVWMELQKELVGLSRASRQVYTEGHHRVHETDPDSIVTAINLAIAAIRAGRSAPPAGLAVPGSLPLTSTPLVDSLLASIERTYNAMDVDGFLGHFSDDVVQLDVNRRVQVKGKREWEQVRRAINAAHRTMERRHRGRAEIGDWVIVEVEWAGVVRGEAVGTPEAISPVLEAYRTCLPARGSFDPGSDGIRTDPPISNLRREIARRILEHDLVSGVGPAPGTSDVGLSNTRARVTSRPRQQSPSECAFLSSLEP